MNGPIVLVNPNLVGQRGDILGSGIPYMPISLASMAATLRARGGEVRVVDAFGAAPLRIRSEGGLWVHGLPLQEIVAAVPPSPRAIIVYAMSVMAWRVLRATVRALRAGFPGVRLIVMENTQAVTSFSLSPVRGELFGDGADAVVTGEAEIRVPEFLLSSSPPSGGEGGVRGSDGVWTRRNGVEEGSPPVRVVEDLDTLPFPAWDLFPLEEYWNLGYSHGPRSDRYLPLLTSRGCPFRCRFCVIPTLSPKWRGRSGNNVAEEMARLQERFGVTEFHLEDLNPTTQDGRIREMCDAILARGLRVTWKLAAGTKIETIKPETLDWMAKAGCRYISFSPETGSPDLLTRMNKPFQHGYALDLARRMRRLGIRSQACFVLGFPGETPADEELTRRYLHQLVKAGVDEVAFFIITPIPGSATWGQLEGFQDLSDLTFSPVWRPDFAWQQRRRLRLYGEFLVHKAARRPLTVFRQMANILRRRFETKMEQGVYRAWRTWRALWSAP